MKTSHFVFSLRPMHSKQHSVLLFRLFVLVIATSLSGYLLAVVLSYDYFSQQEILFWLFGKIWRLLFLLFLIGRLVHAVLPLFYFSR